MKVSEHLSELHKSTAKHERALAEHSRKTADNLTALHKENGFGPKDSSTESTMASHLNKEAAMHDRHAAHHDNMVEACQKAQLDEDLAKTKPDGISGIIRHWGVTPITRAGQPQLGKSADSAAPEVEPELAHIAPLREIEQDV